MRDLETIGKECMLDMECIGFPITRDVEWVVSNRMTKTWGLCTTWRNSNRCQIKIASFLLQDDVPLKQLRTTVLHELAHAYDENKHHHGKEWKAIAEVISDCYGVDIQQYVTSEEKETLMNTEMYKAKMEKKKAPKWEIVCECGQVFTYKRKPKIINEYTHKVKSTCYCPYCKSHNLKANRL